jgi:hypothetical protein
MEIDPAQDGRTEGFMDIKQVRGEVVYENLEQEAMKLAFYDWATSQIGKPKIGFLGINKGAHQFIKGKNHIEGSISDANTFCDRVTQAFAAGFTGYAGVVRSGATAGHYFTVFVTRQVNGSWSVYGYNTLGGENSELSVQEQVIDPLLQAMRDKGIAVAAVEVKAAGVQEGSMSCGFWAVSIARALCAGAALNIAPEEVLQKLKYWVFTSQDPKIGDIEQAITRDALVSPEIFDEISILRAIDAVDADIASKNEILQLVRGMNNNQNWARQIGHDGTEVLVEPLKDIAALEVKKIQILARLGAGRVATAQHNKQTLEQKLRLFERNFGEGIVAAVNTLVQQAHGLTPQEQDANRHYALYFQHLADQKALGR